MYRTSAPPELLDQGYRDQHFPKPSQRFAYLARYYAAALPAVIRPHRLQPPKLNQPYRSRFSVTEGEQRSWAGLFGLDFDRAKHTPFTYATTTATLTFMHLLSALGINFRYVRHVASEMAFKGGDPAPRPDHVYTYVASLTDVFTVGSGRIVLELNSTISDEKGQICAEHVDYFMATDFKQEQPLPLAEVGDSSKRARFEKVSAHPRQLGGEAVRLYIHPNMGVAYGKLSGDMNLVHTTHLAARLLGYPKPFLQGFCTVNLILGQLTLQGLAIRRLQTTFARPVFVGEFVELFSDGERFELVGKQGKVLAYGTARVW